MYAGYVKGEFRGLPAFDEASSPPRCKRDKEAQAATRIQAFYRGSQCRRVTHCLTRQRFDQLADELAAAARGEVGEEDDDESQGSPASVDKTDEAGEPRLSHAASLLLMVKCLNNFYLPHVDGNRMVQLCWLHRQLLPQAGGAISLSNPDLDTFAMAKFVGNAIVWASSLSAESAESDTDQFAASIAVEGLAEAVLEDACQPVLQYLLTRACHLRLAEGVVRTAAAATTSDGVGDEVSRQRRPLRRLLLLLLTGRPPPPPPPRLPEATAWGPNLLRAIHLCRREAAELAPDRRAALRAGLRRLAPAPARAVAAIAAAAKTEAETETVEAFHQLGSLCWLCPDLTLGMLTPADGPTRRSFLLGLWRASAEAAQTEDDEAPARLMSAFVQLFRPEPLTPADLTRISVDAVNRLTLLPSPETNRRLLQRLLLQLVSDNEHCRKHVAAVVAARSPGARADLASLMTFNLLTPFVERARKFRDGQRAAALKASSLSEEDSSCPARTLASALDPRHGMYTFSGPAGDRLLPTPSLSAAEEFAGDYRLHGRLLGAILSAGIAFDLAPAPFSPCFLRLVLTAATGEGEGESDGYWEASLEDLSEVDLEMHGRLSALSSASEEGGLPELLSSSATTFADPSGCGPPLRPDGDTEAVTPDTLAEFLRLACGRRVRQLLLATARHFAAGLTAVLPRPELLTNFSHWELVRLIQGQDLGAARSLQN
ncbi:hypothetical protein BOX15_Mlig022513g2 [Macrostomum lignano]|uniref:HECT-type E3 ubiquitin transferase n=1 Tax=Macrostomum lignano TaxID=282301 RepID=A0A267EH04_9PLAT|nr:hypothetical protein BOX15_Mlig022513g2 [Macrostomum lignano]